MDSLKVAKNAFLEHCKYSRSLSPHTVSAYDQDLSDFLRFCGSQTRLQDIGEGRITGFLRDLTRQRRLSAATAKRRLACLRTFFRWLKRRGVIDRSPFDDLELSLPSPRRLPRALSRLELQRLTAAARPARRQSPAHGPTHGPARGDAEAGTCRAAPQRTTCVVQNAQADCFMFQKYVALPYPQDGHPNGTAA